MEKHIHITVAPSPQKKMSGLQKLICWVAFFFLILVGLSFLPNNVVKILFGGVSEWVKSHLSKKEQVWVQDADGTWREISMDSFQQREQGIENQEEKSFQGLNRRGSGGEKKEFQELNSMSASKSEASKEIPDSYRKEYMRRFSEDALQVANHPTRMANPDQLLEVAIRESFRLTNGKDYISPWKEGLKKLLPMGKPVDVPTSGTAKKEKTKKGKNQSGGSIATKPVPAGASSEFPYSPYKVKTLQGDTLQVNKKIYEALQEFLGKNKYVAKGDAMLVKQVLGTWAQDVILKENGRYKVVGKWWKDKVPPPNS